VPRILICNPSSLRLVKMVAMVKRQQFEEEKRR
jgi:hypothetical protein